jgi:N-acetylmuramoyl-L-alanine amidase
MSPDLPRGDARHRLDAPVRRGLLYGLIPVALVLALAGAALAWWGWPANQPYADQQSADPVRSPSEHKTASQSSPALAGPASASPDPDLPAIPDPSPVDNQGTAAVPSASAGTGTLSGRVVALDPGHGPAGGSSKQVPDGRGGTKDCQTSGTATDAGYAEHAFNYDVALRVRTILQAQSAQVLLTRGDSASEQICVDRRGTFAQDNGADLLVSIHGDGNNDRSVKGFHAIVSSPPLNDAQGQPSLDLANALLARLRAAGFTQNAAYAGGISRRSDIAGVALATKPVVMLELGEMRNPDEAALMSSADGRQRYAEAVAAGIADWLAAHPA